MSENERRKEVGEKMLVGACSRFLQGLGGQIEEERKFLKGISRSTAEKKSINNGGRSPLSANSPKFNLMSYANLW